MISTSYLVDSDTPWEIYMVDGVMVHVKREDLCCPEPGPSFSKIRGVEKHLQRLIKDKGHVPVGVLDTVHSKAGWGVAYLCSFVRLECYDFFPVYKHEETHDGYTSHILRENQIEAARHNAMLVPLQAGRSSILYHRAKKELARRTREAGYMMPNALKLPESVDATCDELLLNTPDRLRRGTWIVSASSGTLAAGVLRGMSRFVDLDDIRLIIHLGYSRPMHSVLDYVRKMAGVGTPVEISIIDEGYEYKDKVDVPCPFPCNEYYDLKAWKWLSEHIRELPRPIVFWNIGS